ncbi:MAG: hypothetical protein QMB98_07405, partial [Flaviflexus sp.]|uniref:hypothetical protein n=1 Tax=Flaviflexus sp. TaxID=1969482 RepID=UPI00352EA7D0
MLQEWALAEVEYSQNTHELAKQSTMRAGAEMIGRHSALAGVPLVGPPLARGVPPPSTIHLILKHSLLLHPETKEGLDMGRLGKLFLLQR